MTTLKESLARLESIQETDLKIYSIQKLKKENPAKLQPYELELVALKKKADEQRFVVSEIEQEKKQTMGQLEINEDRIARAGKRTNLLKTEFELNANQKESDSLAKYNSELKRMIAQQESQMIAAREALTGLESEHQTKQNLLLSLQKEIVDQNSGITAELLVLEKKRTEMIQGVDARILATYEKIKNAKQGQGIAIAADGSCKGCNVSLPPQMFIELSKFEQLETCPFCRRILFSKIS